MGSVQELTKCKQCSGGYTLDDYYKTGEQYGSCYRCG